LHFVAAQAGAGSDADETATSNGAQRSASQAGMKPFSGGRKVKTPEQWPGYILQ